MFKVVAGLFAALAGFALGVMMGAGPHDSAANLCGWAPFPDRCLALLPIWFDHWGWLAPTALVCFGILLLLWAPMAACAVAWTKRSALIPLHEAASHLYGELRGTDLARFTEGLTDTPDQILDSLGNQILQNADVHARVAPSPKWELLPRSKINQMGACDGATGIRYWGEKRATFIDPKVSKRDLRRVSRNLKQNANFAQEWSKLSPPPPKEPNDIADSYPNLRVADLPHIADLFNGDKLIPLLEAEKITAWGRRGSGEPPLIKIPGNVWVSNELHRLPKMEERTRNQTFVRPKFRRYEMIYFDVYLNRAQIERAWPQDVSAFGLDFPENSEVLPKAERAPTAQAITIALHDGPAYEAGLKDASGNSLPDDWVFLARVTGGDKFLSKCQIVLTDRNDQDHIVGKLFDLRPCEQKDMPILRFHDAKTKDSRAFVYFTRPDGEILPDGGAILLPPGRYQIKVLSAEAIPTTLDVHLSKHPRIPGQWHLEEVPRG